MKIRTILSALAAFLPGFLLLSGAEPEINLLGNGKLNSEQGTLPELWAARNPADVRYSRTGGFENGPYIEFSSPEKEKKERCFQQFKLTLVPGEPYRISVRVRTKGFSARIAGVEVIDGKWASGTGISKFPADTNGKWELVTRDVKMVKSAPGTYRFPIFTVGLKGTIAFSDVKLIPLSEKAKNESASPSEKSTRKLPYALSGELWYIPESRAEIPMAFPYAEAQKPVCFAEAGGKKMQFPVVRKRFLLKLPELAPGVHTIRLVMKDQAGKLLSESTLPVRIIPDAEARQRKAAFTGRRLNSLVLELARKEFTRPETGSLTFTNPRSGWVWICGKGNLKLNGKALAAGESMVRLEPGSYVLTYDKCSGLLRVHAVPVLCCNVMSIPNVSGHVADPLATAAMFNRTTLPCVNMLFNVRKHAAMARWTALHRENLQSVGITFLDRTPDPEKLTKLLQSTLKKMGPDTTGFLLDEIGFYQDAEKFQACSGSLRNWGAGVPKSFHTAAIARPVSGIHGEFISAAVNAGQGHGYLMCEQYMMMQKTEEESGRYLDEKFDFSAYEKVFPGSLKHLVVLMGVIGYPRFSMEHYPEVDNKYFLDMQMHRLANSEQLKDCFGAGLWGTHNTGNEMYRWGMALFRHYFVEGNREMLSKRYGYVYRPGHLKNCDFDEGLKEWTVSEAKPGSVTVRKTGFGRIARWASDGETGNHFAVMTKDAAKPNRISQKAKGLVPGKLYSLRFTVADYDNILKNDNEIACYDNRLSVLPAEAELLPQMTSRHVHTDAASRSKANHARVNSVQFVFRAKKPEVTLTLTDWKSNTEPGSRIGKRSAMNFICLTPFFEEGFADVPTEHFPDILPPPAK